jgi:hypothetical protein
MSPNYRNTSLYRPLEIGGVKLFVEIPTSNVFMNGQSTALSEANLRDMLKKIKPEIKSSEYEGKKLMLVQIPTEDALGTVRSHYLFQSDEGFPLKYVDLNRERGLKIISNAKF